MDAIAQLQREEQLREQRWLDSINGARFTVQLAPWPSSSMRFIRTINIKGREIIFGEIAYYGSDVQYNVSSGVWEGESRTAVLRGREFDRPGKEVGRGTMSEDGNSVVIQWPSGSSFT